MTAFFQKLFGKTKDSDISTTASKSPDTIPLGPVEAANVEPVQTEAAISQSEPPQLLAGCGQSIGLQRDHNEDALFALTTTLVSDNTPVMFGLYIVADGMGGHQHGEIASAMAVRALSGHVIEKLYLPLFSLSDVPPDQSLQEVLQEGVSEAHSTILSQAPGGGTTLTAALILGDQLTIAHVGDSRAYAIYSDGRLEVLTRDHSLVNRLVELGQLTSEEASVHPQRNVLYRAIGQGEPFEPDISVIPVPSECSLVLCSDGLWGVIEQEELVRIVNASPSPQAACQELVTAANAAGGPDNISVVLVKKVG